MQKNIVIAIDGYSSCGKSTLAKALAKHLGFIYVDSGAMYRCIALFFLRKGILLNDISTINAALKDIHISFKHIESKDIILLNDEDVSLPIRQMEVSNVVSLVASIKEVRQALVLQQQNLGRSQNIVMDGRDIGTVVFPDAQLKLFMTAQPEVRAQRRFLELQQKGEAVSLEEVQNNLNIRDLNDTSRKESPLIQAKDAIVLDNTFLSQNEQLQWVVEKLQNLSK